MESVVLHATKILRLTRHPKGDITLGIQIEQHYDFYEDGNLNYLEMSMRPFAISVPRGLEKLYTFNHETIMIQLSSSEVRTHKPFCSSMYLHSSLHNIGLGTTLFNFMIIEGKIAFKEHGAYLTLASGDKESNQRLEHFYKKFGFEIMEVSENGTKVGKVSSFNSLSIDDEVEGVEELVGMEYIRQQAKRIESSEEREEDYLRQVSALKENTAYYMERMDKYMGRERGYLYTIFCICLAIGGYIYLS